ncbi:MAG TPA: hypothetical protein PK289_08585 [Bacteroidia bacterium]|jgi:hypothetical protein|nr:hypothetical protein [Bacteroidia bacterium]HRG53016.1 hypothetical protein [Bacteroidia bacterium]
MGFANLPDVTFCVGFKYNVNGVFGRIGAIKKLKMTILSIGVEVSQDK